MSRPLEVSDDHAYVQPVIRRGHGGIEVREVQLGKDILTKRQFLLREGDWLMSKVQILHRAYGIVPPELDQAVASGSYYAFQPTRDLDLRYLWYLSHHPAFHASCELASVGVVIEKMVFRVKDWEQFDILLPPLPEQRKIAAILSSVDDAIAANRKVIEQTERVKKGLLQTLMTRGIGHTRFKKTEIGEIPEAWKVVEVGDVARVKGGKRMPKGRPFSGLPTPHPYIRVTDFAEGTVRNDDLAYVLPADQASIARYTVSANDVYISIAGTVGLVGIIPPELDGAQLTENAAKLVVCDEGIRPDWLATVLSSPAAQAQIDFLKGVGGGVPKLALFRIKRILVPLPPLQEQSRILAVFQQFDTMRRYQRANLHHLQLLKRGLLQDLLTGRVRVQPD